MALSGFETPTATEWKNNWWQRLFNIRNKIIVPYLVITLFVAAIGTYIVTRLVAGSLQERLSNQLIESGRVATESVVRREAQHLEALRLITFASGMEDAILAEDTAFIDVVISGLAANADIPDVAVLNQEGQPLATLGSFAQGDFPFDQSAAVQAVIASEQDDLGDKHGEILTQTDPPLFALAAPVISSTDPARVMGVVVVATPLRDILGQIKLEALADMTFYASSGELVSSTFVLSPNERNTLSLSAPEIEEQLQLIRQDQESETVEIEIRQRDYQGLYVPFRVRGQTVGLLATFLPSEFIVLEGGTSARIFAAIFGLAALSIVLIGFVIASNIVTPISRLVNVSQRVTEGDLTQRSTLPNQDEIGFLGFTFDIMTERLEYRTQLLEITIDALKAETARLSSILKASKTGMIMIDTTGQLSFINQAARTFLEPILRPTQRLIEYLQNLNPQDMIEINNFILAVEITAVVSPDQESVGTLVALQDITQQELAGRLKDRFIARVSHELRTPLTAIKGYSDLVMSTIDFGKTPKTRHVVEIIQQTELLDQMIVQLLAISQMSAGTFSVRRREMDLRATVMQAIEGVKPRLDAAQLTLKFLETGEDFAIHGDEQRLRWAVDHLLDNAIKYTLPGGTITCHLCALGNGEIELIIQDTGVGIRSIDQPHIFDAYYRREATAPNGDVIDPRGLGLGLYVAQNVVEAHQGRITVESTLGEGSTFVCHLPA